MASFLPHTILGQQLLLTKERTLYWEEEKCLILSDLHLGKSGHFRKSGIPIPSASNTGDMHRFISQIQYFRPERVVIVGDLFHSSANREADFFLKWRRDIPATQIELVMGNHDVMDDNWYADADIILHRDQLQIGRFSFLHGDKDPEENNAGFLICGHIHPAVRISGAGRQSLRLPCFHFTERKGILPAFGNFTGNYAIRPTEKDHVFVVTDEEVIRMQ